MRKRLLQVSLALAFVLVPSGSVLGQNVPNSQKKIRPELLKMTRAERMKAQQEFKAANPLLTQRMELHPRYSAFPIAGGKVFSLPGKRSAGGPLLANANTTIWANLAVLHTWTNDSYGPFGYYEFNPTDPISYTSLYTTGDTQRPAQYGIQYVDDHIYGLSLDLTWASFGIIEEYLFDTDTSTGETTRTSLDVDTQLNLAALETAQADDGTVYGEFYNSDGSAFEWGTVDYTTQTRTTIGPATNHYVALGITKEGQLYGIATDGNLYKIDKTTGTETVVGPTGLTISNAQGEYYGQTGEIDQKDNTFYWSALDINEQGGLYEVNLETGAATLISNNGGDQLYSMIIPAPAAADGAPAKIDDAAANFDGASLTGTITFTAPSQTFGGAALTGDVTYTVKANDSIVATGTAAAGSAVTANVTLPKSGSYKFVVTTSNSVGESPKAKLTKWVGYDVPSAVSGLKVSNNNGAVTVSWTAPTTGIHNGVLGALTYDVYRYSNADTVKVASDIADTSYVDNIPAAELAYYTYGVQAKAEGLSSAIAQSNGVVVGSAITPDWTEDFTDANDFNLFKVVDANKDGRTWRYSSGHYAYSNYNSSTGNDDWLFTPPIHLTPGRLYSVTFKAHNANSSFHNTLEVTWGNDTTAAAQTNVLLPTTEPSASSEIYSYDINPTVEGDYYIGFHDNTELADQFYVAIDSIAVEKGALGTAPDAVSGLTVTPGERGALSATIAFTVPTTNVNGESIDKVDSIQIKRDGVLIATLPSASAGSAQSYTDNAVPTNGTHKYEVLPYAGGNFGKRNSASAFIGSDVPNAPQNIEFLDNTDNVLALWDAFENTGVNGGYSNGSNVAVSFFNLEQGLFGYQVGDSVTTSEKGATRVNLPQNPEETTEADGTTQTFYRLAARADGDGGNSDYVIAGSLIIGPSLKAPYKESFASGGIDNGFAWIQGNDQYNNNTEAAGWLLETQNSADGDGGSAAWHAYTQSSFFGDIDYVITPGDEVAIGTPKISLRGATNPKLYFSLYATANDPASLEVKVQTPDGVQHVEKTFDLSTTTADGWTTQEIDLSKYASQRYVLVSFNGVANGADTYIGIDNINVFDQLEYNLAATSITAPSTASAGKTAKIDVTVENYGAHPAKDYSVVLYADDKAVDTVTVSDELAVLAKDTVSLNLPVAINQTADVKVKAQVVYANDLDEDDNTTETKSIKINPSQYTKVNNLKASAGESGVDLSWSAPTAPDPIKVTEDFESYDAFSTDLGDWTLVDGDKGLAGGFFQSYSYPGQGTAFAFDAFNPDAITDAFGVIENNPGLAPHSGSQFAGAPYVANESGTEQVAPDNWIISPELTGKKQTVTFYAFNITSSDSNYPENFDVLYSTTGKDTADFVKIESDVADGTTVLSEGPNWKEISVEVPEGAKYFAIHHNTNPAANNFLFGLDDISFEKVAPGANDSIVGYNIYRDGELIGTVKGDVVVFADNNADAGSHVYNVTVIYQDSEGNTNESGFSNDATITVTGIEGVVANEEGKYDVYTIDGKTVMLNAKSLKGLKSGLYIINDRKYIIK